MPIKNKSLIEKIEEQQTLLPVSFHPQHPQDPKTLSQMLDIQALLNASTSGEITELYPSREPADNLEYILNTLFYIEERLTTDSLNETLFLPPATFHQVVSLIHRAPAVILGKVKHGHIVPEKRLATIPSNCLLMLNIHPRKHPRMHVIFCTKNEAFVYISKDACYSDEIRNWVLIAPHFPQFCGEIKEIGRLVQIVLPWKKVIETVQGILNMAPPEMSVSVQNATSHL